MVKFEGVGAVWSSKQRKIIARFKDGEFQTDDKRIIDELLERGYQSDYKPEEKPEEKPLSDMSVKELREYAAEKEIDLGEAKKKSEILEILEA